MAETMGVQRRIINPWTWQINYGYVQANEITGAQRILVCAGQCSVDRNGKPLHPGDMQAQIATALDNLETVLGQADFRLSDVVRITIYTTDMDNAIEHYEYLARRLAESRCRFASTLLGVSRLTLPDLLIELEATAMA
jgi:enamine deaminase RidA (YjgF/YER057c/UK114 family)